jgi:hypothetical protein
VAGPPQLGAKGGFGHPMALGGGWNGQIFFLKKKKKSFGLEGGRTTPVGTKGGFDHPNHPMALGLALAQGPMGWPATSYFFYFIISFLL